MRCSGSFPVMIDLEGPLSQGLIECVVVYIINVIILVIKISVFGSASQDQVTCGLADGCSRKTFSLRDRWLIRPIGG